MGKSNRRKFRRRFKKAMKDPASKAYVKRMIRKDVETKYDDAIFSANVDSLGTGALVDIFDPSQGTGDGQRIGDKTTYRSLKLRYKITVQAVSPVQVRIIVFQWYPNTVLSVPTPSTILWDLTAPDRSVTSPYYHDYQNQFQILYDRVHTVSNAGPTGIYHVKNFSLKYVKKTCNFAAGGLNGSNKLYVMAVSSSNAVNHPYVFMYTRVYYDDA